MRFADVWLLLKKILVGIVITVVPLAIIAGGLWRIQRSRTGDTQPKPISTVKVPHEN